jgi:hypothetical protein
VPSPPQIEQFALIRDMADNIGMQPIGIVKFSHFGRDRVQRARLYAAVVALRHCAAPPPPHPHLQRSRDPSSMQSRPPCPHPRTDGVNHPLFGKVRALIDKGSTWIKLSIACADTNRPADLFRSERDLSRLCACSAAMTRA